MKKAFLSYGLIISLALAISACGGGGGGSKQPAPTPIASSSLNGNNSSGTASSVIESSSSVPDISSSSSSSAPPVTQLTIQGMAVADGLVEGEVVFTVGSGTYKTTINSSLEYSITLEVPHEDINKPFVGIATGSGSDSWVQLANLFPSVQSLAEQAGEDKVINANEYFGVNFTALTTAEYAEIVNKQLPIATNAERKAAIFSLHPVRAIEQAAMLSRLLTDINVDLPLPTKTTLSYLLNANLAETHLEALRLTEEPVINNYIGDIARDATQVNVSLSKLSGEYFLESPYSQYFLTFNDDGTGQLVTRHLNSEFWVENGLTGRTESFTWIRKDKTIKITFDNTVSYRTNRVKDYGGNSIFCDENFTPEYEYCELRINSILMGLISEANDRYIANLDILVEAVRETDSYVMYKGATKPQLARLMNLADSVPIASEDLVGFDWVSNLYSFTLAADGQARQKNLLTRDEMNTNWTLENNHLNIGDMDIRITHSEQAGLSAIVVSDKQVSRQSLIKRMPVVMSEADWIGRWNTYPRDMFSYSHDVNEDKTWRDGFEGQSKGSWSILNDHTQTALSNGSWRMIRDVLAIKDGKYYISYCQGIEASPFVPMDCSLAVQEKSVEFNSTVFWKYWSYPAFNEVVTGEPLISYSGYILQNEAGYDNLVSKNYYPVASNKLFDLTEKMILEMTSASKNEIELCEYPLVGSCNENDKRKYVRGLEIGLSIGAGGKVNHQIQANMQDWGSFTTFLRNIDKVFMIPKGSAQKLIIVPDSGYELDSISGCGGVLSADEYHIPELADACEISVNFRMLQ